MTLGQFLLSGPEALHICVSELGGSLKTPKQEAEIEGLSSNSSPKNKRPFQPRRHKAGTPSRHLKSISSPHSSRQRCEGT